LTHFSAAQEQEQEQERGFTVIVAKEFHRNFFLFQISLQHNFPVIGCFIASLVFGILPSFSRLGDLLEMFALPILLAAIWRNFACTLVTNLPIRLRRRYLWRTG